MEAAKTCEQDQDQDQWSVFIFGLLIMAPHGASGNTGGWNPLRWPVEENPGLVSGLAVCWLTLESENCPESTMQESEFSPLLHHDRNGSCMNLTVS